MPSFKREVKTLFDSRLICQPANVAAEIYCTSVTKTRNRVFKILSRIEGKMSRVNTFLRKITKSVYSNKRPYNKSLAPKCVPDFSNFLKKKIKCVPAFRHSGVPQFHRSWF